LNAHLIRIVLSSTRTQCRPLRSSGSNCVCVRAQLKLRILLTGPSPWIQIFLILLALTSVYVAAGVTAVDLALPQVDVRAPVVCTDAFSYDVNGGEHAVVFTGLPHGRALYPAVCVISMHSVAGLLEHYAVPHVAWLVRTRVMCQASRARAACTRRRGVGERAPLWAVTGLTCVKSTYIL
jgi:hypothetical protein